MGVLGSIFGFGDTLKRRLKDAASNPRDFTEMAIDQNQNEWRKNPDERAMGFFNPVPLGTMGKFVMDSQAQKIVDQLSRRDFLKKSAGLGAGAVVGSKLLAKFAPEERAIAKQAAVKQGVAEAAPKYKYNSLKDYLDDVNMAAKEEFKASEFERMGVGADSAGFPMTRADFTKKILHEDEAGYEASKFFYKDNLKDPTTGKWINPYDGQPHSEEFLKNIRNTTNDFSPQAKKEMSAWKEMRGRGWENIDDFSRESIGRGLMPNHNGSLVKNPANDTYHHYLPGQEGRISDGFNSLDEARNSMTKTLQEAYRSKIQNGF